MRDGRIERKRWKAKEMETGSGEGYVEMLGGG